MTAVSNPKIKPPSAATTALRITRAFMNAKPDLLVALPQHSRRIQQKCRMERIGICVFH
jgi:hypothetical protein